MRFAFYCILPALVVSLASAEDAVTEPGRVKAEYVESVTRGGGLMPWQSPGPSEAEKAFRAAVEERKTRMLAEGRRVTRPVLLSAEDVERARCNVESADWARSWFAGLRERADFVATQPDAFVSDMIAEQTPWHTYGFSCPSCVGTKSQQGAGARILQWDVLRPNEIRCTACGQVYPHPDYPETAIVVAPRMGQEFTFCLSEAERRQPDDRSGRLAHRWVGRPMHASFSGIIRLRKIGYMIGAARDLALAYRLTAETRYAETATRILVRLAQCYRKWLYHDYWDAVADCDPLYAAWNWNNLPIEWKRHLSEQAYEGDTLAKASMLQSYWGAGRYFPSTDSVGSLAAVCLAYDLVADALDVDGRPLWSDETRSAVERDLILEWIIGAEPFVGGEGKADCHNNKAPRVYNAQAAVAVCLGLPELADTALRGYEGVRDESFLPDGFSRESPAYTDMYLSQLIEIPERLAGFVWPQGFPGRQDAYHPYGTDRRLRRMYRAVVDQVRPDGRYLPLSDTSESARVARRIVEIGRRRYPDAYAPVADLLLGGRPPGGDAVFHGDPSASESGGSRQEGWDSLPEICFPSWMTAILRHGAGEHAALLALTFSPAGGHRQNDNLALYYVAGGQTILGDLGYVGDMPVNRWIRSTLSHNLVIVDDGEQRFGGGNPRRPEFRLMFTGPELSAVEAASDVYDQCREYRRLVVLFKGPGSSTFTVDIFRVRGGAKHDYRIFSELASSDAPQGSLSFENVDIPPEPALPVVGASVDPEDIFGLRDIREAPAPAEGWSATWRQPEGAYRLRVLSESDRVRASNGPGQRLHTRPGRRVRYVDALRTGDDLESVFVAIHEPAGPDGAFPIRGARMLPPCKGAGPDAVAVEVDSAWGRYLLLSEFAEDCTVGGIRFRGRLGVACTPPSDPPWTLALGSATLQGNGFDLRNATPSWAGPVTSATETELRPEARRPADWPRPVPGYRNYLRIENDGSATGFPVLETGPDRIRIDRFPLTAASRFELHTLRRLPRKPRKP